MDALQVTALPLSLERVASHLGLAIRYEPFQGSMSSCVIRRAGGGILGVNSLHSKNRQRFALAHSMGHHLLHPKLDFFVDRDFSLGPGSPPQGKPGPEHRREREANDFAMELLMPCEFLERDLKKFKLHDVEDDLRLRDLANRYGVSGQALNFRMMVLKHF